MNQISNDSRLIIIRGPSASGKSTIANELFSRTKRPMLLISEDTIRKMFSDHTKTGHLPSKELAVKAVLTGLENGFDVIYQGILRVNGGNENRFDELLSKHPKNNYFFYLDVSLGGTIKRHKSRLKSNQFSAETMKKWWNFSSPTHFDNETIITEEFTLEQTVETISKITQL